METIRISIPLTICILMLSVHVASGCYQVRQTKMCYVDQENPYSFFATKTDYTVATGLKKDQADEFKVEGCEPVQFFLYNRHTTRYPDREEIIHMSESLPRLQEAILKADEENKVHLCKKDIKHIKEWKYKFEPSDDNQVTKSGEKDTKHQAHRFKKMFPTLLPKHYSPDDYVIGFTSRIRTLQTAKAFLKEVLKDDDYDKVEYPEPKDKLLQFHKDCDKILKEHNVSKEKVAEVEKFEAGPMFQTLRRSVSWRLGFDVTAEDVADMLRICAFEFAMKKKSPWCAVFSKDDLQVLEFREDLDDYYKDAYGKERNYEQSCPVVAELVYRLKNATSGSHPKAVLYFSHAGGFKKVLARFGLFKDASPLLANRYCEQRGSRAWRSSLVSPFAANIVFVLFRCGGAYKVHTFVNESPVAVHGCPAPLCPLDDFLKEYGKVASSCDLNEICVV